MRARLLLLLLGSALWPSGELRAQDAEPIFGAEAVITQPVAAGSDEDSTAAATELPVDGHAELEDSLGELVREAPGTSPRRFGALGSFAGVSLRGGSLDQTMVLLDELPLGPAGGGAFDLSMVPVSTLRAVEVYRGGTPTWLGVSPIGGALRLRTREASGFWASQRLDLGSFGGVGARLAAGAGDHRLASSAVVGLRHTRGDYPYVDDGGTRFDASDDRTRRRQNGRVDEGYGLLHARLAAWGGELSALVSAFGRTGGLTGSPVEEPTRTRQRRSRLLGALAFTRERGEPEGAGSRLSLAGSAQLAEDAFSDALGEAGLGPRVTRDRGRRLFLRGAFERRGERLALIGVLSSSFDHVEPRDALRRSQRAASDALMGRAALEGRVRGHLGSARAELRLSGSAAAERARLASDPDRPATGNTGAQTSLIPNARLAAVVETAPGLALSASVATGSRRPTLTERFGDGAFLTGNAALSPERGVGAEVGAMWRGRVGALSGSAELRGFWREARDLIRWVRTSRYTATAQNIDRARVLGGELGARLELGTHAGLVVSGSYIRSEDLGLGRPLPLRPALGYLVRPEVRFALWGESNATLYAQLDGRGATHADPAALVRLDAATRLDLGATLALGAHLRAELLVQDVFDARPSDLLGFPLPGRRVSFSLTVLEGAR